MRRLALVAFVLPLGLVARSARADGARDPASAREHLKLGYELKKAGRCEEALPHFAESARLDPRAKPLLNAADCEEALGHFVAALERWVAGRDLARSQGDALATYADARLAALDVRMPRLTLRLAADVPEGSEVRKDGVALGAVSLGVALPIDPGNHVVTLRTPAGEARTWSVAAHEGDRVTLELTPAPPPGPGALPIAPPAPVIKVGPLPRDPLAPEEWDASPFYRVVEPTEPAPRRGSSHWVGWIFEGGAGVAAVGSAVFFARSSALLGDVRSGGFASAADIQHANDTARSDRSAAIGLAIGAVALAAVGIPFLLARDSSDDDPLVALTPRGFVF